VIDDPHEHGSRTPGVRKTDQEERLFAEVNARLADVELPQAPPGADPESLPVVYVVGAPRSGTTLLHQLVARHLDVGYIDNVVARFWARPSVGIALSEAVNPRAERPPLELVSRHGTTAGAAGPHEFGYFWRRVLGLDGSATHHLTADAQAELDITAIRRELRGEILAWLNRPVVFKNVICGFHAALLTEAHPRSLFVHVTRDDEPAARSILHARMERYGNYETWWSLKPSTWPFNAAGPAAEVVRQVRDCREEIAAEVARAGVHAVTVPYDDLCADPERALTQICDAVGELGWEVPPPAPPFVALTVSAGRKLPAELESDLHRALTHS
jgi:LPS sulfotransferase NodH